jgi:hypothetical protein
MNEVSLEKYIDRLFEEQEKRTALALAAITRNQTKSDSTWSLVLAVIATLISAVSLIISLRRP